MDGPPRSKESPQQRYRATGGPESRDSHKLELPDEELSGPECQLGRRATDTRSEGAGRDSPGSVACDAPGGPSGLPCQNSNNCRTTGYKLHRKTSYLRGSVGQARRVEAHVTEEGEGLDHYGRAWELKEDGKTWERVFGGPSPSEARTAFALRRNVEAFAAHYRRENCGFMTLTPERGDMTPKQFGQAWHAMRKDHLKWVKSYVRVLEPQKRAAPHYHLCVATEFDLRPGEFNWEALFASAEARKRGDFEEARRLTRVYAESAPKELRECWADLRRLCRRFGLGRSEFLPFRKESGAVAEYVGKYLEGGLTFRQDSWKGARRVEYDRKESRNWKACGVAIGWNSPGAKEWRTRVGELAAAVGATDEDQLRDKLGRKWCYHARADIMTTSLPEWYQVLRYLSEMHGGEAKLSPRWMKVGGVNVMDMSEHVMEEKSDGGSREAAGG